MEPAARERRPERRERQQSIFRRGGVDMATTDIDNDTGTQANASENGEDRAARLRRQASEAYGAARERAQSAYASTRQGAADGIDASPIAALVGGFAVGALLAG